MNKLFLILFTAFFLIGCSSTEVESTKEPFMSQDLFQNIDERLLSKLNPYEEHIIVNKGTEMPFSGTYNDYWEEGTYYCRRCDSPLYYSKDKFDGHCGWPSFDDEIPNAVIRVDDADGIRTEIICATCNAHLGHVFIGERFTDKNTRHCVNSASLIFREGEPVAKAVFAAGCFWGVEYLFEKLEGVYSATSGYSGGTTDNPTYREVLTGTTGHLEAVEVSYNPLVISYENLVKYFFEIHDPTQTNGQGPDIGPQYLSAIFYRNRSQFETALKLIDILETQGLKIATQLKAATLFYKAEEYHQNYYEQRQTLPYCHTWQKRF